MITKTVNDKLTLIQLVKNVFDNIESDKDIILEMGQYHSNVYIEDVPLTKRIYFNFAAADLSKIHTYVIDFSEEDKTKYEETFEFEAHNTKGMRAEIMKTFNLYSDNHLFVDFRNFEHDQQADPGVDPANYHRLEKCWNVYFHGFMDKADDIAYVLERTEIQPGIYEVEVYGEPAILFLWNTHEEHHHPLKGLIVRKGDEKLMADAQFKYDNNKVLI